MEAWLHKAAQSVAEIGTPKFFREQEAVMAALSNNPTGYIEGIDDIHYVECPRCEGLGVDPDSNNGERDCFKCEGTGEVDAKTLARQ